MRAGRLAGTVAVAVVTAVGTGMTGHPVATAAPRAGAVGHTTGTKGSASGTKGSVLAGGARAVPHAPRAQGAKAPRGAGADGAEHSELRTAARFAPPMAFVPSPAVTYDMGLVPAGARIEVEQRGGASGTTVLLHVSGARAGHAFGARVHTGSCGAEPSSAGRSYQHRVAPLRSATDPAYANAGNEVWLDFTVDARGAGAARAHHAWGFRKGGAGSVVLLDRPGVAGEPVACFTVPFVAADDQG